MTRIFLSVPWCCVLTMGLALSSVGGMPAFIVPAVDRVTHLLIPVSGVVHLFVGVHLYRNRECHEHQKREKILFWVSIFLLCVATLFHFTPWHDHLLGHAGH